MGFWPFGKKKERSKFAQTSATESKGGAMITTASRPYQLDLPVATLDDDPFSDNTRSSQIPPTTSNFEKTILPVHADLEEALPSPRTLPDLENAFPRRDSVGSAEDITALPIATELERSPHLRPVPDIAERQAQGDAIASEKLQNTYRSGTVRSKRSLDSPNLFRRRTNNTRRDDVDRAEEVKAIGAPVSALKAREMGDAQRRESKRGAKGSHRRSNPPNSSVSLPYIPADLSTLAAAEHHFRFNVGSMAVFSPRPTIRHIEGSDYGTAAPRLGTPSKGKARKDERTHYSRSNLNESKRIDHLADDLDAGTIREVMERERKRQEKKQKSDEERALRKLQRRAEKQRVQEEGLPKDWSALMYTHAHDITKKAGDKATEPDTPTRPGDGEGRGVLLPLDESSRLNTSRNVFADFDGQSTQPDAVAPIEKPIMNKTQTVGLSSANLMPLTSPIQHMKTVSALASATDQPTLSTLEDTTQIETDRRESDLSAALSDDSASKGGGWMAIFRRNRLSSEETAINPQSEASHSNASRDSMSQQRLPAHLRNKSTDTHDSAGSPVRMTSIFREDLPETSHSRSSSAVASPVVDEQAIPIPPRSERRPLSNRGSIGRMARRSMDQTLSDSPTSSAAAGSGVAMTQSLASVDSEASWLSGKPKKTLSQQTAPGSASLVEQPESAYPTFEDSGAPDEEQNRRITPGPEPSWLPTSGDSYSRPALAVDTDQARQGQLEPPEEITQGDVAHSATFMPPQNTMKSQEGLLNMAGSDDDNNDRSVSSYDDEDGEVEVVNATVQRTPSVSVATHARQVSAGSAKLLDMQQELEPALERATSVSYSGHARQVSAGSAKLLDIASTPRKSHFEEN